MMTIFEVKWVSFETLRLLAAVASCFILIKIFDWLRLFEGTSFYIILIEYTLKDISQFLLIYFVSLITFGMPLHMIDLNRANEAPLIHSELGFWPLDIIYN